MTKSSFQNKSILPDFPLVEVPKDFLGDCLRKQKILNRTAGENDEPLFDKELKMLD